MGLRLFLRIMASEEVRVAKATDDMIMLATSSFFPLLAFHILGLNDLGGGIGLERWKSKFP